MANERRPSQCPSDGAIIKTSKPIFCGLRGMELNDSWCGPHLTLDALAVFEIIMN